MVTKPTHDSGTIIDHVYASPTLKIEIDVNDCYYNDHDCVLCCIKVGVSYSGNMKHFWFLFWGTSCSNISLL